MVIFLSASTLHHSLPTSKPRFSNALPSVEGSTYSRFPWLNWFNRKSREDCKYRSFICLSVKGQTKAQKFDVVNGKNSRKRVIKKVVVLSEGRDDDENHGLVCPGCGVYMQDVDPDVPGYYKKKLIEDELDDVLEDEYEAIEGFVENDNDDFDEDEDGEDEGEDFVDEIEGSLDIIDGKEGDLGTEDEVEDEGDWDSDEWEEDELEEVDGFTPVGVGYGNVTEEVLEKAKRKRLTKAERKRLARENRKEREEVTVCARCHSLRNYGQVKNQTAENLIPDFDFDRLISTRLMKPTTADSTVVVMVVDCVDFDGSFPKRASRSLFKALEGNHDAKASKKLPKLVLVATKVDLLPSQISPTRLDRWVRHRARALGAPKLNAVYLVSSRKDLGVRNLLSFIKEMAGPRGHVWVIGAQNAGKSTLINTFAKKEGAKVTKLTEAAVPGTTLGILRVGGVLSGKAKMYDTPGLLHPYLMAMRLSREEQKMIEIRKELRPRSYRIKVGQTIHVGGLVRLDLVHASVQTIYVTVCASPNVSLHLGKIENAEETWNKHIGVRLQPPIGTDGISEIVNWKEREFKVSGTSWDVNSCDIAVAGLGWLSLGLKGEATLKLRTYDSVEVVLREPLVLDRAPFLERPGFWLPQSISDALGNQSKLEARRKQQLEEEEDETLAVNVAV
ncbi:GTP-binding protein BRASSINAZOLE INSENSITIVE PALE GREEN 2, chloroplastic [Silene latifolia]|uniref:GTP-binding protein BRASSINAZOLE INSENSITIVE PALE GREEN 2, chloroplastic n=1 Tax=Silene latifolia TaxID=37657 RepID=UPI003D771D05